MLPISDAMTRSIHCGFTIARPLPTNQAMLPICCGRASHLTRCQSGCNGSRPAVRSDARSMQQVICVVHLVVHLSDHATSPHTRVHGKSRLKRSSSARTISPLMELDHLRNGPIPNGLPSFPSKEPRAHSTRLKILHAATGIYFLFECGDSVLCFNRSARSSGSLERRMLLKFFFGQMKVRICILNTKFPPLGAELPLLVPNHNGKFMGWTPWHYDGDRKCRRATSVRGGEMKPGATISGWTAEIFVPFALLVGLGQVPPAPGTCWRGNFYRIDYDNNQQDLFAWARVASESFHDLQHFGLLQFT